MAAPARCGAATSPLPGACRAGSAAPSMRRSIGIRMRGKRWRCARAAARPSPIGRSARSLRDGRQAGRLASGLPARDRAHPPDQGAPRPYRPSPAGRFRLWPPLQDQGRPTLDPGRRRPWPPSGGRRCTLTSWFWSTPEAEKFFTGRRGFAGGFAPIGENPESGAMTQAARKSAVITKSYSSHTRT